MLLHRVPTHYLMDLAETLNQIDNMTNLTARVEDTYQNVRLYILEKITTMATHLQQIYTKFWNG